MSTADYTISGHAVERWRERVDPTCRHGYDAADAIRAFLADGVRSTRARRWLRNPRTGTAQRQRPGVPDRSCTVYVYNEGWPGVALVIAPGQKGPRVATVLTREVSRERRQSMEAVVMRGTRWATA